MTIASRKARTAFWCASFVVIAAWAMLLFVSFDTRVPEIDLDSSWVYAIDVASSLGLSFGRDVVFTFGPLASVYTAFAIPGHRTQYLFFSLLIIVSVCAGLFIVSGGRRRWLLFALPLCIGNLILPDAVLLTMPGLLVFLASKPILSRLVQAAAVAGFAAVLGVLPLIKGSAIVPTLISVAAASVILAVRRRPEAALVPLAFAMSVVAAWVGVGQSLASLPDYARRQGEITAGFTDAMSLFGHASDVRTFLAATAILLGVLLGSTRPFRTLEAAVAGCLLFIGFKAGFVRHDAHAMIAASSLVLVAFTAAVAESTPARLAALAICAAAWAVIDVSYVAVGPAALWERTWSQANVARKALTTLVKHPDRGPEEFLAAKRQIATETNLPPTDGPVDLYGSGQTLLLAADRVYDPRPVIQSYAAYTPALAELNRQHLLGDRAPRSLFVPVAPIDDRYPSLDDGPSWPVLLSLYRWRTFADDMAVLDRDESGTLAKPAPPDVDRSAAFGERIEVGSRGALTWATLRFRPTWLGRLVSLVWKLPLLSIEVTYEDGHVRPFRMIAGMAEAGFLLSPTVATGRDFAALRSRDAGLSRTTRVRSFRITQGSSRSLWGRSFEVRLSELVVAADPGVDDVVTGRLSAGPAVSGLAVGGDCAIDRVGRHPVSGAAALPVDETVVITGWGHVAEQASGSGASLWVAVTPDHGGETLYALATRVRRPDVDAELGTEPGARLGFEAALDTRRLSGSYRLAVVQDTPAGRLLCDGKPVPITRPQSSPPGQPLSAGPSPEAR